MYYHNVYLVAHSCPTLWDTMDWSPPGSSVYGILQARKLELVAIPFSRGSSWPRDRTRVSRIAGRFFTAWATREVCYHTLLGKTPACPRHQHHRGPWTVALVSCQNHNQWLWCSCLVVGPRLVCMYTCMCAVYTHLHNCVFTYLFSFNTSQGILMCSQILKPLVSGKGNGNPLQYPCLGNPMDREEPGRLQSVGSQKSQVWLCN